MNPRMLPGEALAPTRANGDLRASGQRGSSRSPCPGCARPSTTPHEPRDSCVRWIERFLRLGADTAVARSRSQPSGSRGARRRERRRRRLAYSRQSACDRRRGRSKGVCRQIQAARAPSIPRAVHRYASPRWPTFTMLTTKTTPGPSTHLGSRHRECGTRPFRRASGSQPGAGSRQGRGSSRRCVAGPSSGRRLEFLPSRQLDQDLTSCHAAAAP